MNVGIFANVINNVVQRQGSDKSRDLWIIELFEGLPNMSPVVNN